MAEKHYDAVGVTTLQERARGPSYRLKKYHNAVKRELYERFAAETHVDLGCGRGGDVRKWHECGIERVAAFDASEVELEEARRRAAGLPIACTFERRDLRDGFAVPDPVGGVSAMFCLNYFWESEEIAGRFLDAVAASLRRGGKFFGCCADADAVRAWVAGGNASEFADVLPEPSFYDPGEFGQAYVYRLRDTVLDDAACAEYLVSARCLRTMCAARGLEQIWSKGFRPDEEYPGAEASRLYRAFAFAKI